MTELFLTFYLLMFKTKATIKNCAICYQVIIRYLIRSDCFLLHINVNKLTCATGCVPISFSSKNTQQMASTSHWLVISLCTAYSVLTIFLYEFRFELYCGLLKALCSRPAFTKSQLWFTAEVFLNLQKK